MILEIGLTLLLLCLFPSSQDNLIPLLIEGVKNSMTLGLTDPSPWASDKGEPKAWHDLKYLGHTFEIRENPKGNQNPSARIILEDTCLMKDPLYKEMFCPSRLGLLK